MQNCGDARTLDKNRLSCRSYLVLPKLSLLRVSKLKYFSRLPAGNCNIKMQDIDVITTNNLYALVIIVIITNF